MKAQPFNSVTTTTTADQKNTKVVLLNFRGHVMKMTQKEFEEFQERLKEWDN